MTDCDKNNVEVSIILPCYNEQGSVSSTLENLIAILADNHFICEIIVVDDGSTDKTREIVKQYPVTLICHSENRGYGATLKTGIRQAKYDTIAITDADGTYPTDAIPDMILSYKKEKMDMVVGSRTSNNVKIPIVRKPAKWFITRLGSFLARQKIPDLNSGLRIMKKSVVEKFMHLLPDGFSFTSTITIAMLTNNYNVKYQPIDYFKRKGKSKIRPVYDTINFIQLIIRTILYFEPLRIFLTISLPIIFVSFVLMIFQIIFFRNISTISVIMSMAGIQLLAIGMIADLIVKRDIVK